MAQQQVSMPAVPAAALPPVPAAGGGLVKFAKDSFAGTVGKPPFHAGMLPGVISLYKWLLPGSRGAPPPRQSLTLHRLAPRPRLQVEWL